MRDRAKLFRFARLFSGVLMATGVFGVSSVRAEKADFVHTESGPISGTIKNGVRAYLGIPYAAPPVGSLRWEPPQPPAPWKSTLPAVQFGNTCPQNNTLGVFAARSNTEDCLYLNVYASGDADDRGRKRPVMFWIHGGGLLDGESNDYDGSKLVRDGKTVVVTINYRLGALGFFAHPSLDKEGHRFANYGLMDQQFALQWVRRNISAFGGDPNDVTIFGESAGGGSVIANLASPSAKGLFQQAISESGGYAVTAYPAQGGAFPLSAAEQTGTQFAAAAGCNDQSASCLRGLSVAQILNVQAPYLTGLIIDGSLLTQTFKSAFTSGEFNHVPFINGSNRDEWRWFVGLTEAATGVVLTAAGYPAALQANFGAALAAKVLAKYPLSDYPNPSTALGAAETDSLMACTGRKLSQWVANQIPSYAYEFDDRTAPIYFPPVSFNEGAYHTSEIQYLFPLYHGASGTPHPLSRAQEALSDRMVYFWTHLSRSREGEHPWPSWLWPKYDASLDDHKSFRLPYPIVTENTFGKEHKCDFWDSVLNY